MTTRSRFFLVVCFAWAIQGGSASASIIFSFTTTTTTSPLVSSTSGTGTSRLFLSGNSTAFVNNAQGVGTDISFAAITKSSTSTNPDVYTVGNNLGLYQFMVLITDQASGLSHTFAINGRIIGAATFDQVNTNNTYLAGLVQSFVIGSFQYTVDVSGSQGTYSKVGNTSAGSFGLHVTATPSTPPTSIVPEPSTFISAAFAGVFGLIALKRSRRGC